VPQGSVLGPLLFTLCTSDLLARLQCPFAAYADDVKIFSSSNECTDINKLQIDLNFVTEWSDQWCVPLNPDKCSVMYLGFNKPKKLYQLGNRDITVVENQNDLGVLVNNKLNWGNRSAKAARISNSPLDTPMIMSDFIFAVTTCYQHDKLFTRRQIQLVPILLQSHCIKITSLSLYFQPKRKHLGNTLVRKMWHWNQ
jgi:hypothetical protein